jgi:hypothetical protein
MLCPDGLAKNARTGQTKGAIQQLIVGGSIESLSDAEDQAKKAKNQEAPGHNRQAGEGAGKATKEGGRCSGY